MKFNGNGIINVLASLILFQVYGLGLALISSGLPVNYLGLVVAYPLTWPKPLFVQYYSLQFTLSSELPISMIYVLCSTFYVQCSMFYVLFLCSMTYVLCSVFYALCYALCSMLYVLSFMCKYNYLSFFHFSRFFFIPSFSPVFYQFFCYILCGLRYPP